MEGTVEVRKTEKAKTWYNAQVLDMNRDRIKVMFEDKTILEVPPSNVRHCPREATDNDSWDPQVDSYVEVYLPATDTNPSGWSLGRIKTIKNCFYFIAFEDQVRAQELIVEKDMLRKANEQAPIDVKKILRELVEVDKGLKEWIQSSDSSGCLGQVQHTAGLLVCSLHESKKTSDTREILLLGDDRAVRLGRALLTEIHFKHQLKIQNFHATRERLTQQLEQRRSKYKSMAQDEFSTEESLVGKIIGKGGENLKRVQKKYDVKISVVDTDHEDKRLVRIYGEDADNVKKAREEIEYVQEQIPVPEDQVGWILGKGFQNIRDIALKAELHYARFNNSINSLELCGLRQQVEDARCLIDVHKDYLQVYQHMDQEHTEIQKSFEQLNKDSGKSGSKGGKWGKDSNKENNGGYYDRKGGDHKSGNWDDWEDDPKGSKGSDAKGKSKSGKGSGGGKGSESKGKGKDKDDADKATRAAAKGATAAKGGSRGGRGRG